MFFRLFVVCLFFSCAANVAPGQNEKAAPKFNQQQLDFFETKVRPLLAKHCYECHGPKKQESELRLDSRDLILSGGASGEPAAIAGKPDQSILLQSIKHTGDYEMPPEGKLTDAEIKIVSDWIKQGLPWPAESAPAVLNANQRVELHQKEHWAYQPISPPQIPAAVFPAKTETPIDSIVQSKLKSAGLTPSEKTGRRKLIRRMTFDLIGLPPTNEEVRNYLRDSDPNATDKVIDRLLSSPHYGERWGRHWLDVARYADTQGYAFRRDRRYPYAFTYRDYVISAFNDDLPYDTFIKHQIAADLIDLGDDKTPLAALGFITVGRKYLANHETLDDQIDAVTRGFLGLTVACARCHDHKYDAVPTEDYYSLFGIFNSTQRLTELPLIGNTSNIEAFQKFTAEKKVREKALNDFLNKRRTEIIEHSRANVADYLVQALSTEKDFELREKGLIKLDELLAGIVRKWQRYLIKRATPDHPTLRFLKQLHSVPSNKFAETATKLIAHYETLPNDKVNSIVFEKVKSNPPKRIEEVSRVLGECMEDVFAKYKKLGGNDAALQKLSDEERQLGIVLLDATEFDVKDIKKYYYRADSEQHKKLQEKIDAHEATSPEGLLRAMAVKDKPNPSNSQVYIRGNPGRRGKSVPRQYLAILSKTKRTPVTKGSGRLELANEIASPKNPLTARVLVNRIWMHHFGKPLVDTPSDFGIRCEEPKQRKLLDYLAYRLMKNGWSIKSLHREILLSHTYQQLSNDRPECRDVDPENRLYWKANRKRLDFEPLRDSLLAVAGELDQRLAGKSVNIIDPNNKRRTVYGVVDRQDLPNLFRTFNFASPDQSAAKRPETMVPQQSLFMMNSKFVSMMANRTITHLKLDPKISIEQKIQRVYLQVLKRQPTRSEIRISKIFVRESFATNKENKKSPNAFAQLAQVLFFSNEFEFID